MICSMTGYSSVTREFPFGTVSLELRSVNHRYLDIQFRMPDELRPMEPAMREILGARLHRGKVDCRVGFAVLPSAQTAGQLAPEILQRLAAFNREVLAVIPEAQPLRVVDVLRWPGMFGPESLPVESLREACMELLQTALEELAATRQREGEKLRAMIAERAVKLREVAATVGPRIPGLIAAFEEKLASRVREAVANLDDDRLRQEITLFASKIDVDEELSRLNAHLDELTRILRVGGTAGKRLDFLMQELNREANTLGSKSVDTEISRVSMEIKVLIEQMREQIQNIE
jgi:uncharacterized protein (TIGR00255 family)